MAIPEYKNGHFEEMAAWSQILKIAIFLKKKSTAKSSANLLSPERYRDDS